MNAAIYSRKSKFTGKGESVENQVQLCKEYAEKLDIKDFIVYEDEGFSGGNIDRPQFQQMLKDAKEKKFDVLICYRLDRISRNIADFSTLINELQDLEIDFISIREQFDTSTPMGRAMMYIASVFAQLERETIAERIRDNMLELAKTGRWLGGQTPLGFESEKVTFFDEEMKERSMRKLSPIKEELEIAKLVYSKYLKVGSIALTMKFLLSNNIKGKQGGDFGVTSINSMLRNPVYVQSTPEVFEYLHNKGITCCGEPNGNGILTYNKKNSKYKYRDIDEWYAAVSKHKGIIKAKDWLRVQEILDENKSKANPRTGTSQRALLGGLLKCKHCGSPMRVSYGRKKKDGTRTYYYTCTLKCNSGKTRCNNPNVRGDEIERAVIENIKKLNNTTLRKELESSKNEVVATMTSSAFKDIANLIKEKENQMNTLITQLSKVNNEVTSNYILTKVDNLGNEIKNLKLKLCKLNNEKQEKKQEQYNIELMIETLKYFHNNIDEIHETNRKRLLLQTIIDKITWDGSIGEMDIKFGIGKKK